MIEDIASRLSLPDRQGVKVAIAVTRNVNGDGAFFGFIVLPLLPLWRFEPEFRSYFT